MTDTDNTPLVDVLIVTWNRREEVSRCILSALSQDYSHFRVVVMDNGSTDGTSEMIRRDFPQVTLVCSHKNLGAAAGKNVGYANCIGEYTYCLDDDGWLDPSAIRELVETAKKHPEAGGIQSQLHLVQGEEEVGINPNVDRQVYVSEFLGGATLLRRELISQVGWYPDDFFRHTEETDLSLRMLDVGYRILVEPKSVMYHAPSCANRDSLHIVYLGLRNGIWTGLRYYPFPYVLLRVVVNFAHAVKYAFLRGRIFWPLKLTGNMLSEIALQWTGRRKRCPVKKATIKRFLRNRRCSEPASKG